MEEIYLDVIEDETFILLIASLVSIKLSTSKYGLLYSTWIANFPEKYGFT